MSGKRETGTTFVELMGAMTIISLATLVMLQQLAISYREGTVQQDKLWAYDKGTQILAELQSSVERGTIGDAEALHALADDDYNPRLTTVTDETGDVLPPDHPMSGNWQRFSRWVWGRQLLVTSPPGQDRIRYVALRLAKYDDKGMPIVMAQMTSVITLPRRTYPSTTVFDVYVLALAEVPSTLGSIPSLRTGLESTLHAAASRAPSLEFRVHWITRLGYGRDPLYTPWFDEAGAASSALPVYRYAGRADDGTQIACREYHTGRYRTQSAVVNDYDVDDCPAPHAIADQFNHCLRLQQARTLFDERVAAGLEREGEPPLHVLLADIADDPARYRNAILINLHGDGVPFPPVRNYSDAAAAPDLHLSARVVTHGAKLHAVRDPNGDGNHADSEDVDLRVYAYNQDPAAGDAVLGVPITVQVYGGDFRPHLAVRRLPGGVDTATGAAGGGAYAAFDSGGGEPPTTDPGTFEMWCETGYSTTPEPHTWIRLHNTPLVCPPVGTQGLPANARLYGMDYVPAPLGPGGTFSRDLATAGTQPKNTARWRIRIAKSALGGTLPDLDQMLTVDTRIGTDPTTGRAWPVAHQPRNLSTTYVWWARSADAVPPSERHQFLGDPRHNPYADVAAAVGYNTCFAGSGVPLAASDWDCIDASRLRENGFGSGVCADVPRAVGVWRSALQEAGIVFVNAGPLADRLWLGGELCAPSTDGGSTPGRLTLPGVLFGRPDDVLVDSASNGPSLPAAPPAAPKATLLGEHVVVGPGSFWAKPWLGELCDDADHAQWFAVGNVDAGPRYRRAVRGETSLPSLPPGAAFAGRPTGARIGAAGGTAFVQAGTALQTFAHASVPGATGTVSRDGRVVPRLLGMAATSLQALRPFATAVPGDPASPHFTHPADFPPQVHELLETHVTSSATGKLAGGLLRVGDASGASAFVELLAATPIGTEGTRAWGELCAAEAVRAFYAAGASTVTGRIEQIARVEIVDPQKGGLVENPNTLVVTWRVDFMGFDGQPPTAAYATGFSEDESELCYALLWSRDGGRSWAHAQNGSPATPGTRPPGSVLLADAGTGAEAFSLPTPSSTFPAGELLLRVEAYHAARLSHYSHHTVMVSVTR